MSNYNADSMTTGHITVTGTLVYVIEGNGNDEPATANNNWDDDQQSEISTVPEDATYLVEEAHFGNDSGINWETYVEDQEDEEDDVDLMETLMKEFMEEKLREEKEKQEDEDMEDLSPVSKTNKLRALVEKYGHEGNKL